MPDEDVVTPLGYVRGEMEVVGAPKELNVYPQVTAGADNGQSTTVSVQPGGVYAIPLAPGKYKLHATYGTATSRTVDVTVENGKTETVDFAFGKDVK
jgi:hypothetical protein